MGWREPILLYGRLMLSRCLWWVTSTGGTEQAIPYAPEGSPASGRDLSPDWARAHFTNIIYGRVTTAIEWTRQTLLHFIVKFHTGLPQSSGVWVTIGGTRNGWRAEELTMLRTSPSLSMRCISVPGS